MVSKDGGINFNQPKTTRQFDSFNRKMQLIQEKYQIIYSAFGGEKDKAPDLRQPENTQTNNKLFEKEFVKIGGSII